MQNKAGITLIETVVSLLILAVTCAAIVLILVQVMSVNTLARMKNQANTYAQQGLEQVRAYYQTNGWTALKASGGPPEKFYKDGNVIAGTDNPSFLLPGCVTDSNHTCGALIDGDISFRRAVGVKYFAPTTNECKTRSGDGMACVMVRSGVYWDNRDGEQSVEFVTFFYDYQSSQ